jgi:hypothetical protein
MPETVFNAMIEERNGAFTGSTHELNMRRPWLGPMVTADIDGVREGQLVTFSKSMDGSGGMRHVILYEGVADSTLTRIEGHWRIPADWSGSFFMIRDDPINEAEAQIEVEAEMDTER